MDGIIVCKKCNATIIVGEQKKHKHTDPYMIEGDVLWVRRYDEKWYKHDLPSTHSSATTKANNRKKQPDSELNQREGKSHNQDGTYRINKFWRVGITC